MALKMFLLAYLLTTVLAEMDENPAVIIDCGSGICKAGLAGDFVPKVIFPAVVGYSHFNSYLVGEEAENKRGMLTLKYPIEFGIVVDWDDMIKV